MTPNDTWQNTGASLSVRDLAYLIDRGQTAADRAATAPSS